MLITRQIPALWNGISQQPAPVRLSSQCEEQVNCWSSVIDGVSKRNPSEVVAILPSTAVPDEAHMHIINRDISERYVVIVANSRIRVFALSGQEIPVTAPLGWDYLNIGDPGVSARNSYTLMTVADYTFVLNKTKRIELAPVGADNDPPTADYWWINRYLPPTAPLRAIDIEDPDGGGGYGGGGTYTPPPSPNPTPQPPPPEDPDSNPVGTFKGDKQTLQDLPTSGNTNGDVWRIIGNAESDFATYYVMYQDGGWYECVRPGLQNMFDPLTMPHALVRMSDGSFVFGPFAWVPRHVGDDKSNPHPTFVHRKIRDMFFHRNRLGFCVDENVIMSRAGAFGTFHRLTVVDYLADEVIDIAASETKVTKMEFAVPMQGSMMLFSDQTQFQLQHRDILSGGSVSLDVTTRYPMVAGVRPAAAGSDIYFPSHSTGWGRVREYFVNTDSITYDAADVTSHVPNYIPYGITQIATASDFDTVFVLSAGAPNKVFVYNYYWQSETEKAQSAWHHWEFQQDSEVLSVTTLGSYLYLLMRHRSGGGVTAPVEYVTTLERIPLFKAQISGSGDYQVYLDRRFQSAADLGEIYDYENQEQMVFTGYPVPGDLQPSFKVIDAMGGIEKDVRWISDTSFVVERAEPGHTYFCGFAYESRYVFSRQYPQNSRGDTVLTGRLQLRTFSVYYTHTAYFRVEVRPYGRDTSIVRTREFPAQIGAVTGKGALSGSNTATDSTGIAYTTSWENPNFADGKATFAVQANASEVEIALVNDSYLGFTIHSAEWEGFYFNRARA